jgi:glyoxylase-like metal-dependent hydrolase (beta-lactamase superfamily II)
MRINGKRFFAGAFLFVLGCVAWTARAQQGQDVSNVEIKTVPVADGLYVLLGVGGNIGVSVGSDGILLIDAQSAALHQKIEEALKKLSNQRVRFLINTHDHGDHTGGNGPFGKDGVVIIAHETLRDRLANPRPNAQGNAPPPAPKEALPMITYKDTMTIHFNGEEITLIHPAPAHTDNDTIVYFRRANVMHLGDLIGSLGYPPINIPGGFTVDGMIAAAKRTIEMANANTKFITGHRGPVVDLQTVKQQLALFTTLRDRIAAAIREGKTLEQVVASKPTAEFDAGNQGGRPPDEFVTGLYNDLVRTARQNC